MAKKPAKQPKQLFRVLALDGGGAKGFYTLGVLKEIEGIIGCHLHERFDIVFGTSTGAIIRKNGSLNIVSRTSLASSLGHARIGKIS